MCLDKAIGYLCSYRRVLAKSNDGKHVQHVYRRYLGNCAGFLYSYCTTMIQCLSFPLNKLLLLHTNISRDDCIDKSLKKPLESLFEVRKLKTFKDIKSSPCAVEKRFIRIYMKNVFFMLTQ